MSPMKADEPGPAWQRWTERDGRAPAAQSVLPLTRDMSHPPEHPAVPAPRDPGAYGEARESAGAFHETQEIHRLLVETVRDYAIFALDRTGHILTWNAGAERLKGYSAEEIIGQHFSVFYPEEEVARRHPWYELKVATAEGKYEESGWRIRKDGSRFWANVLITALRDPSGELVGFAKVTRDLTERRAAEEALRESEQRFRLLVQGVRDYGIFMLDPGGHIASWNEGAERIKGYTREEILGRHFSIFYPQEDIDDRKPEMELEVAGRVGRFEDEGWRLKKDGSRFWANVVITRLRDPEGRLIGFSKVTRDLTARRAAELQAIQDARRVAEAEAANRAKSEFLAAMSHELRTPLNAIGGYVDLLAFGVHGDLNEAQLHALERVRGSQQHLLALITDLLNFSRIEAGRLSYDTRAVPLAEVTETVRSMIQTQALARDITIEWLDAEEDAVAMADRAKVQQILLNLLTNAVKYTEPGGHVQVRPLRRSGLAVIEVEDSGIGIPEEHLDAVFEPFLQVGRTLTSAHEGTGLGLAISRDLARAMGGDITVRSTVDEGSTFTLTLPGADEA